MLPIKHVPVMAVIVNKQNEACGFSKPLTSEELAGKGLFTVYIDRDVDARDIRLEFATPSGVIHRASNVSVSVPKLYAGIELRMWMK